MQKKQDKQARRQVNTLFPVIVLTFFDDPRPKPMADSLHAAWATCSPLRQQAIPLGWKGHRLKKNS
jgi:hypothetical protein